MCTDWRDSAHQVPSIGWGAAQEAQVCEVGTTFMYLKNVQGSRGDNNTDTFSPVSWNSYFSVEIRVCQITGLIQRLHQGLRAFLQSVRATVMTQFTAEIQDGLNISWLHGNKEVFSYRTLSLSIQYCLKWKGVASLMFYMLWYHWLILSWGSNDEKSIQRLLKG